MIRLPSLEDMLAMGVPETAAKTWNNSIQALKYHANTMAMSIENDARSHFQNGFHYLNGYSQSAKASAKYYREACN